MKNVQMSNVQMNNDRTNKACTLKTGITGILLAIMLSVAAAAQAAEPSAPAMADGEIRKIDMDAKKITIRHGPIPSLNMPPMTMVFQVSDPALLEVAKAGDKIRFEAVQDRGAFVVNRIEPAR